MAHPMAHNRKPGNRLRCQMDTWATMIMRREAVLARETATNQLILQLSLHLAGAVTVPGKSPVPRGTLRRTRSGL